jgi:hypothetical protein
VPRRHHVAAPVRQPESLTSRTGRTPITLHPSDGGAAADHGSPCPRSFGVAAAGAGWSSATGTLRMAPGKAAPRPAVALPLRLAGGTPARMTVTVWSRPTEEEASIVSHWILRMHQLSQQRLASLPNHTPSDA